MKRIVAFIFVLALSALILFAATGEKFDYGGLEKVCFVCAGALSEQDIDESQIISAVESGAQAYVTVKPENAQETRQKIKQIDGYVLHFNKNSDLNVLKKQFFDFSNGSYRLGDYQILEGYTSKYDDFREVDGKRYNVQLAITPDEIIVGFPAILTGF